MQRKLFFFGLYVLFALVRLMRPDLLPPSDGEVFLYRAVQAVYGDLLPLDQGPIGTCVAVSHAGAVDTENAQAILAGKMAKVPPVSPESIYGGARNEAAGRVTHSHAAGANGYRAIKWLKDTGGVLFQKPYPQYGVDLSKYSVKRADQWGAESNGGDSRLDGPLDAEARKHPIKDAAKITTLEELDVALKNGHTVTVCSNLGFQSPRDKDGFCAQRGSWSHCMHVNGKRDGGRPGYLLQNSWYRYIKGDGPNSPNKYKDQPDGSFYITPRDMQRILNAGDSWAVSNAAGFPKRVLPFWQTEADAQVPDVIPRHAGVDSPELLEPKQPTAPKRWVKVCNRRGGCSWVLQ